VSDGGPNPGAWSEGVSKMKAGLAFFFLLVALLVQEQEARMGMMRGGGGGGRRRYNQYARRPWEAGYIGQYGSGRRYWDSDAWRRGGRHQGGLSVSQEDDWRPPAWDNPEVEPYAEEQEEECDWMCTQERMQELAREQEQLQEERRVREQQRREEERSPASQTEAAAVADDQVPEEEEEVPELYPDWSWDSEGNRRMWEWRRREEERRREEREERERKPEEDLSSCTGMCRIMRMRTGK